MAATAHPSSGTATVLFTDVVGSTALRTRLGDAAVDELRRVHDQLLNRAVGEHHGAVVKHLGDGIMAAFVGVADAVTAGVVIQQAIAAHNARGALHPLAVRVGISVGDVTWENGDCYGVPAIEASRLCAAANGGQILVADVVRGLVRGRGGHTFAPMGALTLKGLPEPVAACEVRWEPLPPAANVPLPPRLAMVPALGLFGRGAEQGVLAIGGRN